MSSTPAVRRAGRTGRTRPHRCSRPVRCLRSGRREAGRAGRGQGPEGDGHGDGGLPRMVANDQRASATSPGVLGVTGRQGERSGYPRPGWSSVAVRRASRSSGRKPRWPRRSPGRWCRRPRCPGSRCRRSTGRAWGRPPGHPRSRRPRRDRVVRQGAQRFTRARRTRAVNADGGSLEGDGAVEAVHPGRHPEVHGLEVVCGPLVVHAVRAGGVAQGHRRRLDHRVGAEGPGAEALRRGRGSKGRSTAR